MGVKDGTARICMELSEDPNATHCSLGEIAKQLTPIATTLLTGRSSTKSRTCNV